MRVVVGSEVGKRRGRGGEGEGVSCGYGDGGRGQGEGEGANSYKLKAFAKVFSSKTLTRSLQHSLVTFFCFGRRGNMNLLNLVREGIGGKFLSMPEFGCL